MKNRHLTVAAAALLATFVPPLMAGEPEPATAASPAPASDTGYMNGDLQISLTLGYESLHVYRGADSSLGSQNIWQGIDVEYKDLLHFNLYHGSGTNSDYEELTPSAYVHHDFGLVDAAFGVIWYHFPDYHSQDSLEYYLRFSKELGAGFDAWLHIGYNQDADGWYEELGLKYTHKVTDRWSLSPYASIAMSQHYRGTGEDGLDNVTVGITAPYQLTEKISLTPIVGLAVPLDTFDARNELWGALSMTVKF